MRTHLIKERPDLFSQDETVSATLHPHLTTFILTPSFPQPLTLPPSSCFLSRPGILVLVNDCDWELMDGLNYALHDGDVVIFISTLHGG